MLARRHDLAPLVKDEQRVELKLCGEGFQETSRLSNEMRLSCGAELKDSQTEFYNTERERVTAAVEPRAPPASSAC